ncbi:diguanylate cyclase (GGDEF)-like protein/excisionase family DNA binding protein [Solirubrobacter pauli]|uniref:Diguanylate cyclase (GGDEF)-like protein/excisionase family DNA binding protein n=1 Tax=Solirubrobacter pauli TaxID=166793 RepID=A0A660L4L2_9ACTN|nr:EAL domain-containing protein [Solirubrobacter pauli]RKQ87809.1 diguanylate cyclase (GGDEF)-like protein/excisionase family DNA binding protein [Solirubrobacter pauli]
MSSQAIDVTHAAARLIAEGRAAGRSGLQDVAELFARTHGCACVIYLKSALRGAVVPMAAAAVQPEIAAYQAEFVGHDSGWPGPTLLEAFRRGETLDRTGKPEELSSWIGPPAGPHTLHFGLHSLFGVPVRRPGAARIAGVVVVGRHAGEPPLTDVDRAAVLALVDALTEPLVRERDAWEMHERLEASVRAGRLELLGDGRLATAFRYSSAGIAIFTLDPVRPRVVDLNERLAEVLGASPHALLARDGARSFLHPDDLPAAEDAVRRLHAGEVEFSRRRLRLLAAGDEPVACDVVLSLARDAAGVSRYGLCQIVDVEEPRRAHHPLAREVRAQEMLAALGRLALEGTPDAHLMRTTAAGIGSALAVDAAMVLERRPDGTTATVAAHGSVPLAMPVADELPGAARLLEGGRLPSVWRGAGVRGAIVAPLGLGPGPRRWLAAASYETRSFTAGEERVVETAAHLVSNSGADRRERPSQPPELAALPGREQFADRVTHAIARAGRQGESVAVLTLDVDGFRDINDTFGYEVGDELLASFARRLEGALRAGDTLARLGGDEFGIVCEDISGERGTIEIVRRVIGAFDAPVVVGEHVLQPAVSIGVALGDWVSSSADSLMRDAETALQRAQDQPGTTYELFDRTMRRRVAERIRLEHDLRRALENDELVLHYQPLVSLHERQTIGLEALVRWQHPERGLVPPGEFIPAAESSGLILALGRWVIREACRQLKRWDADPSLPRVWVSVNVSGRQIAAPGLVEEIGDALQQSGLEPDRLALELTETVLMEDAGSPLAHLQRLKALGVRLLLDDFGTGYSSLNYVKRFPLDGLKVDRSFIAGIADAESDRHILRAIVSMATALDVTVIAEGVETPEQASWIASMDCDTVQGFGVARPAPATEVEALLRAGLAPDRVAWSLEAPVAEAAEPTVALGEATDVLGVSPSTIRRWADTGRIAVVRTPGGHRRFPVAELHRLSAGPAWRPRTQLREVGTPTAPLPVVAELLRMQPDRLQSVAAGLYETGRHGWFARETGVAELSEWAQRVAAACDAADWDVAEAATQRLSARAELGGSTLLERFLVVERFGALVVEVLQRRDSGPKEVAGARRLFTRLARGIIEQT